MNAEVFLKMTKLRFLKIDNVLLPEGLSFISNNLRTLEWHGYPLKSLPMSFQPDKLVELNMCFSHIEQLGKGIMVRFSIMHVKVLMQVCFILILF